MTDTDRRRDELRLAIDTFAASTALLSERITEARLAFATECAARVKRAHAMAVALPSFERARRGRR